MDWLSRLSGLWFDALIVSVQTVKSCGDFWQVLFLTVVAAALQGAMCVLLVHRMWSAWSVTWKMGVNSYIQAGIKSSLSITRPAPPHPIPTPSHPSAFFIHARNVNRYWAAAVSLIQKPPSPPLAILSLCASLFWLRRLQCSPKALNGYLGCRVQQVMLPWTQPSNWLCLAD